MAIKTKAQVKDVFSGVSSLWYQSTPANISTSGGNSSISLTPDIDVPVKVDTFNFEQGDPSLEHYKVLGLSGDWVVASEPGDIELSFRVPSKHTDILKMAFGNDAVATITGSVTGVSGTANSYTGDSVILKTSKVTGTWVLVNEDKSQLVVFQNTTLFAKAVFDQDAKGVFAVDFSGTIESDGANPDIIFLKKVTT